MHAPRIPIALTTGALALAAGGCGASDEERIRTAVGDFQAALDKRDSDRACELMTDRAEAQFGAFLSLLSPRTLTCAEFVRENEPDEDSRLTRREIERAKIAVRDDLAVLRSPGEDDGAIGLREVDGDWRVDNIFGASLSEQPRGDARLAHGGDEQQIRATLVAAARALARKDYRRLCRLMSYGAEAQVLVGAAFASIVDPAAPQSLGSCAAALRRIERLGGDEEVADSLANRLPSARETAGARIAIRGSTATVRVGDRSPAALVRFEGHWLLDAEPKPTAADYAACWRAAGAAIATRPAQLRFAASDDTTAIGVTLGRVSVRGDGWRIFYTLPADGDDPGLDAVLRDPGIVDTVAYVRDATRDADVVAQARDCGD